jgi:hypothetical protein
MDLTTLAQEALSGLDLQQVSWPSSLAEMESKAAELGREMARQMLLARLGACNWGYEGSSRACECGHNQRFVGYRQRTLASSVGELTYWRAYYHCKRCGRSCCPFDQAQGLGSCQCSVVLAQQASVLAVHDPFSSSAELLRRLTGQRLSDRTINRLVKRVGRQAGEQERQRALAMATWTAPTALVRPKRLYVAVDGTTVHLEEGWREVKCVTCYWEDQDGRRHARYQARLESAEQFRAFVWALACQCGLEQAAEVVLLGDGAAWIWDQIAGVLGERTICITDWYHVTEHLWSCARVLHGEGTAAGDAWVERYEGLLWKGKAAEAIAQLEQECKSRRGAAREAMASLITYLRNQGSRLRYDQFRRRGLDIGSGRVEAMCKQVGVRMKRAGMCWSQEGCQALLSLRSVWLNGQWDDFWQERPMAA